MISDTGRATRHSDSGAPFIRRSSARKPSRPTASIGTFFVNTVIVVGSDASATRINDLSWRLDPGQQLVVAPQLVGVAGSRIHTRPVSGLPLIHVETPSYDGPKRFAKRATICDVSAISGTRISACRPARTVAAAARR